MLTNMTMVGSAYNKAVEGTQQIRYLEAWNAPGMFPSTPRPSDPCIRVWSSVPNSHERTLLISHIYLCQINCMLIHVKLTIKDVNTRLTRLQIIRIHVNNRIKCPYITLIVQSVANATFEGHLATCFYFLY